MFVQSLLAACGDRLTGARRELIGSDDGDLPLGPHWNTIRRVVERGQRASLQCAIASVDINGRPQITPVATVFLRDDPTGFYVDQFPSVQSRHLDLHPQVCLMALDTGAWFWLRSLAAGRFAAPPGVRLYGQVGALRAPTEAERAQIERRARVSRWMKGGRLLWSAQTQVREIRFTAFRPIRYPSMMDGLWGK